MPTIESDLSDIPERLKQNFLNRTAEVCVLPDGVMEAFRLSSDPSCPIEKFAKVIEKDVNLAAEILKVANSPLFGFNTPVSDLQQAAIRLGMKRCRHLIMAACVSSLMKEMPLEVDWAKEVINHHCRMAAAASMLINEKFGLGFSGEEYTAGLLHDFGRLALAAAAPESFAEFDDLSFIENDGLLQREIDAIGTDHCQFGAWYVESLSFPAELVDVVRWHHHGLGHASLKNQALLSLTRASDHFVNFLQREEPIENYDFESNEGLLELAHLQRNGAVVEAFGEAAESIAQVIGESVTTSEGDAS